MLTIKTKHFILKYVDKLEDLPEFSNDYPLFSDIESDGLYINPRIIQYYQPETSPYVWILDLDYFGEHTKSSSTQNSLFAALGREKNVNITRDRLKESHKEKWIVWWNGSYDQGTLRFGSKKVDDLWYMVKIRFPRFKEFNLGYTTKAMFPDTGLYEDIVKSDMQKEGFKPGELSRDQLVYASTDVYVMKLIWDQIAEGIRNQFVYQLNSVNLGYTVKWQQNGLKVNEPMRKQAEAEFREEVKEISKLLPDVNVNSPKQVCELLGTESSDQKTLLHRAADGCPYSENILKKRSLLKSINFLETYHRDRVYAHYNPFGTRTGRWSCKGGKREEAANLQQLPRKLKKVFGFQQEDDMVFVGADLPTAELRLAAAVYVDEVMIDAFINDRDLHILTASNDANVPIDQVTDDMRKKAKASNFGLLYGMKANKFMEYAFEKYGIVYTLEEAEFRRNSWMKTYPGIARTIKEVSNKFFKEKKNGSGGMLVSTPSGLWVKPELYTDALNIPIQGAVAEISKLWIRYMYKIAGKEVPIVNMVHDSVTLECKESEAKYWQSVIKEASIEAWVQYCKLPMIKVKNIPMDVEVTIGKGYQNAS